MKCKFHKVDTWNDGRTDNVCLYIKSTVECDGVSKTDLMACPLWGNLVP